MLAIVRPDARNALVIALMLGGLAMIAVALAQPEPARSGDMSVPEDPSGVAPLMATGLPGTFSGTVFVPGGPNDPLVTGLLPDPAPFSTDPLATGLLPVYPGDPYAEGCTSGCHPSKHPTPILTLLEFERLREAYAAAPVDESSRALDTLLFYGEQTRFMLHKRGPGPLDEARADFLATELMREVAWIELQVIDANGVRRVCMPPQPWPFDVKRHYFPGPDELIRMQVPDINGTVKRVGLGHIWVRC